MFLKPKFSPSSEPVNHVQEESDDDDDDDDVGDLVSGILNYGEGGGSLEPADGEILNEVEETADQIQKVLNKPRNKQLIIDIDIISAVSRYQDILTPIIDGKEFFIDGDSLLMLALTSKGLSLDVGGQTLHIIYVVEKFLLSFLSRNLKFTVIFFEIWNICWEPVPHFNIARAALKLHLLHNQRTFSVLSMKSTWEEEFSCLIEEKKPSFILMATELPNIRELVKSWNQFVLSSQSVYCGFLHLDIVDIKSVYSSPSSIMGMVQTHHLPYTILKALIMEVEKEMPVALLRTSCNINELPASNFRSSMVVLAAVKTLNRNNSKDAIHVVKTLLLSAAILDFLPLKMRCFKNLLELPLQVTEILKLFLSEMSCVLIRVCPDSPLIDFRLVGDLWQGKFVQAVFHCVCEVGVINCKEDLGHVIASRYEELLAHVNKEIDENDVHPYPIEYIWNRPCPGHVKEKSCQVGFKNFNSKLTPTTCKLTDLFTGAIASNKIFYSESSVTDSEFHSCHEQRHWHNNKPMTDAIDRIPENASPKEANRRYSQNNRNGMARYLTIYGLSLEGRSSTTSIVTRTSKPIEKKKKQVSQSKSQSKDKLNKKEKIIEANKKRIQEDKLKQIKDRKDHVFMKDFNRLMLKSKFSAAAEQCDVELQHASEFPEIVLDILFLKGKACFEIWKSECYSKQSKRNYFGAKEIFLVIREIFKTVEENKLSINDLKQKNELSFWFHELGFKDLCAMNSLPDPAKNIRGVFEVGMNHVEFQLDLLGADLIRETGGIPDPRADGFIPDPWQVELFDIIDKKQSALVIAPTSSGKTYASYYCMEQVIRDSDDGVVVYVCPTKALVNQVHATIHARFKKTLPPGKVLLGVMTRDYKSNTTSCQILITIPECLEILLMSPRCQTWARMIKYIIFDEVHCLVAQSGGLSWENCILLNQSPFIALSATISKPEEFCAWLQKVEDFKKNQAQTLGLKNRCSNSYKVSLIKHLERHNHLIKYVMMNDGSLARVHPYSILDVSRLVPEHISMSPDEALELYVSMKQVLVSKEVTDLSLLKYFHELCPSGFLSMQSVQKFSKTLRDILCKETTGNRAKVFKNLRSVDFDFVATSTEHILKNIPIVVKSMKKNKLMPALCFSYNRQLVDALSSRLLRHLRAMDDFLEDEDSDVEIDSDTERSKKPNNKFGREEFRKCKGKSRTLGLMRGPNIVNSAGSLRGAGAPNKKLIDFIEARLLKSGHAVMSPFPSLLRRGLGKHHSGLNSKERTAVEMLFRSRVLNLIFATGTLALGIHMPCKTVVVAGDSRYLNALEYHQMSGRAGRRGFDKEGNVIFYGLHKRKITDLMTGRPPSMVGNFPLNASLILRLLLLVSDTTIEDKISLEATSESYSRAYTLLENGLLYESQEHLKSTMKYFFSFVIQFLMRQNLLQSDGKPHAHATFITHLHYHEPSNFAFYFLLKSGVLEEMCCQERKITEKSLQRLVIVLNFLFCRVPVTDVQIKEKKSNSKVLLPPLPLEVQKTLIEYNNYVLNTFSHYFMCVASDLKEKYGEEKSLPLSQLHVEPDKVLSPEALGEGRVLPALRSLCSYSNVCSVFPGLSGNTDEDVSSTLGDCHHVRENVNVKVVPTLELDFKCNSYALDFYKHGIRQAICRENGLRAGSDFALLQDFLLVLKSLYMSLTEMLSPDANLLVAMERIIENFSANFRKAYFVGVSLI